VKVMGYVGNKEDPPIQIVRTHQHHTNPTLLQTVKNFKKSVKTEVKQIKIQKEYGKRKGCRDNFHIA